MADVQNPNQPSDNPNSNEGNPQEDNNGNVQ